MDKHHDFKFTFSLSLPYPLYRETLQLQWTRAKKGSILPEADLPGKIKVLITVLFLPCFPIEHLPLTHKQTAPHTPKLARAECQHPLGSLVTSDSLGQQVSKRLEQLNGNVCRRILQDQKVTESEKHKARCLSGDRL